MGVSSSSLRVCPTQQAFIRRSSSFKPAIHPWGDRRPALIFLKSSAPLGAYEMILRKWVLLIVRRGHVSWRNRHVSSRNMPFVKMAWAQFPFSEIGLYFVQNCTKLYKSALQGGTLARPFSANLILKFADVFGKMSYFQKYLKKHQLKFVVKF